LFFLKMEPALISWSKPGNGLYVAGSWNNWTLEPMFKVTSGRPYEFSVMLEPGLYQYRFIVDGRWQYDTDREATPNLTGSFNNVLLVEEPSVIPPEKSQKLTQKDQKTTQKTTQKSTQKDQKSTQKVQKSTQKVQNAPSQKSTENTPQESTGVSNVEGEEVSSMGMLEILAEHKIYPHKDAIIDLTAKRPVGHNTHNLFLKDSKSKKLYLITFHQSINADLKTIQTKLNAKTLRFAPPDIVKSVFGIERGCITSLSLLNDKKKQVISVFEPNIFNQPTLTICSGCKDPLDHSQHNVVDVPTDLLLNLLKASGHDPQIVEF